MTTTDFWEQFCPPWMAYGACVGNRDPDLFFPATEADLRIPLAKAICHGCPVTEQCLEYALSTYQTGIWGGTTDLQRKVIRDLHHS